MSALVTLLIFSVFGITSHADDGLGGQPFGAHHGYVADVREEKNKRDIELVMLEKPKDPPKSLGSQIVNEKLTREFQIQYENRFGQTQAEQVINSPGQFDEYTYFNERNVTLQQYQVYQRQFAEYMSRRLTEYHVDNWAKNDPEVRTIYAYKDKVSNLNMQVSKGYRIKWKYNFAGPNMDVKVENPYDVEARVRVEMNGIASAPEEVIYNLGYQVTPRVWTGFMHKSVDGIYQLVCSRRMTKTFSTSITGSTDTRREGPTVQQDLVLLGFSWTN